MTIYILRICHLDFFTSVRRYRAEVKFTQQDNLNNRNNCNKTVFYVQMVELPSPVKSRVKTRRNVKLNCPEELFTLKLPLLQPSCLTRR